MKFIKSLSVNESLEFNIQAFDDTVLKRHISKIKRFLLPKIKEFLISEIKNVATISSQVEFTFGTSTDDTYRTYIINTLIENKDNLNIVNIDRIYIIFNLNDVMYKVPLITNKSTSRKDENGYHNAMGYTVWINQAVAYKNK